MKLRHGEPSRPTLEKARGVLLPEENEKPFIFFNPRESIRWNEWQEAVSDMRPHKTALVLLLAPEKKALITSTLKEQVHIHKEEFRQIKGRVEKPKGVITPLLFQDLQFIFGYSLLYPARYTHAPINPIALNLLPTKLEGEISSGLFFPATAYALAGSLLPQTHVDIQKAVSKHWNAIVTDFPPGRNMELDPEQLIDQAYARSIFMTLNPLKRQELEITPDHWFALTELQRKMNFSNYSYPNLLFALTVLGAHTAELQPGPKLEYTLAKHPVNSPPALPGRLNM